MMMMVMMTIAQFHQVMAFGRLKVKESRQGGHSLANIRWVVGADVGQDVEVTTTPTLSHTPKTPATDEGPQMFWKNTMDHYSHYIQKECK